MKQTHYLGIWLYCLLVSICCAFSGYTQQLSKNNFEIITTKNGLPSNDIYQIVKDSQGFVWLATAKGLYRYDGYRFVNIGPKALADKIALEGKKHLIVNFFSTGIFRINIENHVVEAIATPKWQDSHPDNDHFNNVFVDAQQRIWASDFHHAKYFDARHKRWVLFPLFKHTADDVTAIRYFTDNQQRLWILALNKLFLFNEQTHKLVLYWQFSKNTTLRCITAQRQELWLGTLEGKIIRFFPKTKKYIYYNSPSGSPINALQWQKHHCWIASSGSIYTFDSSTHTFASVSGFEHIKPNFTSLLFDAPQQLLWLASDIGLLNYKFNDNPCETINLPAHLVQLPSTVTCFQPINPNRCFVGLSQGGILQWDRTSRRFKAYSLPLGVGVNDMALSSTNDLLIATTAGLFVLNNHDNTCQKILPSITQSITHICFDRHQRLWLTSDYKPIQIVDYQKQKHLSLWNHQHYQAFWAKSLINDLCLAPDGKMWLASWYSPGFGLCYFDETQQAFIQIADLAPNRQRHNQFIGDYFLGLYAHQKRIYASGYGGLNILDNTGRLLDKFEISRTGDTFPNDYFANIAVDSRQHIWVGTSDGLLRFSPNLKQMVKLLEEDGLLSNNTSKGFWLNDKNELWIGQKNGFNILHINYFSLKKAPLLSLSSFQVLGGTQRLTYEGKSIDLARSENNLSLTFSPLNFAPTTANQYRYRLVGIHNNWIYNGSNNTLVLVDLAPNTYQLEVAIGTNHGIWSTQPFRMTFSIAPSFIETSWFKLLLTLLVLLIGYALYRYRINQLLKIEKLRTEISADLHDDVGATLSSISILSTLVQHQVKDTPIAQKYLHIIQEDTASLQNKLEEIVWSLRSDRDTVEQLTARIRSIGAEIFEAKGIQYEFNIDESIGHLKLSMDFRRNLLLITKEAVNNIVKYADCQQAHICIEKVKNSLVLTIRDNGKGFQKQHTEGNGLKNMEVRARKMRGKLTVHSIVGQGTTVQLLVPLTQMGD